MLEGRRLAVSEEGELETLDMVSRTREIDDDSDEAALSLILISAKMGALRNRAAGVRAL